MNFIIDSPINAMAVSHDGLLAVAGRSLLKVYSLSDETGSFGTELFNMRSSNLKNLNFSNNDVAWCPVDNDILATAATNGAVVVWNLQHSTQSKIVVVFNDHKRTVNKVCFHSNDSNLLLSGSQDGCMKLFDLRNREAITTFVSNSESVRDVQFSPNCTSQFASVQETGNVEIWDIRRPEKPECNFLAHDGPVFACEYHPNQESNKWLATGGRDKTIKVWDLSQRLKPNLVYNVHTITPVSKLKWRPEKDFHIGSCSLVVDFSVYVWDIKRPYVPFAIFGTRKDVTTGFAWKNDPFVFISSCKDGTIYQHRFETDAYYPAEHYPPIGIDFNPYGEVAFSTTDFIYRHSQTLSSSSNIPPIPPPIPTFNRSKSKSSLIGINTNMNTNNNNNNNNSNSITSTTTATMLNSQTSSSSMINITSSSSSLSSSLTTTATVAAGTGTQNIDLPNYQQLNDKNISINNSTTTTTTTGGVNQPYRHMSSLGSPSSSLVSCHHYGGVGGGPKSTSSYFPSNYVSSYSNSNVSQHPSSLSSYNISVPISYRKTNENILAEHFRCMVSYMMLFSSEKFPGISYNLSNEISMNYFIHSAKNYLLSNRTFEDLCEHNADICDSLNRYQIAQTWRMIRYMFSSGGRHPSGGGPASGRVGDPGSGNPSGGTIGGGTSAQNIDSTILKSENPSRHTSGGGGNTSGGGGRHFSGNNQLINVNQMAITNVNNNNKDSDDEDHNNILELLLSGQNRHHNHHHHHHHHRHQHPSHQNNNFPSLKQQQDNLIMMPSNKFMVDFFDFHQLPPSSSTLTSNHQNNSNNNNSSNNNNNNFLEFNNLIESNRHFHNNRHDNSIYHQHEHYDLDCQEWELQRESIFHRHNIAEYSIQMNELNGNNHQAHHHTHHHHHHNHHNHPGDNYYDANSSISYDDEDEDDDDDDDGQIIRESPGFFNVNINSLLSAKNPAPPIWLFNETVANMLRFYVNSGDVQTAVSIILVLGDQRMKQITLIDQQTMNIWFRSYIDLLHRFRLWNISTRLIQLCSDPDIQSINQSSTSTSVCCATCFKPIRHGSTFCEKCRQQASSCSICHVTVRGLYIWCQGCAHGGHIYHMLEWFKKNSLCPTGCGHQCELC